MSRDMFGNDLTKTDSFGTFKSGPMKTVPCQLCGNQTPMVGVKLCVRCWELRTRIEDSPEIARKVLDRVDHA